MHHIEALRPERLDQFERLAEDFVRAYAGDLDALDRLTAYFGSSYERDRAREHVRQRVDSLRGTSTQELPPADARLFVARLYGFETWATLVESLAQPQGKVRNAFRGFSATPPFYRIDTRTNSIEARPPISNDDWDTVFAVAREMRLTALTASCLTDEALARLPQLDQLTCLRMDGAQKITDDGLKQLARMPQLEELDLSGRHSPITDRGLEVVRHLPRLRRFQMCWPQRITDAGVAHLRFCDELETVDLMGTPTGDGAIDAMAGKPELRTFRSGKLVTDVGLPLLHRIPAFKTWQGGEVRYDLMTFGSSPNHLLLDGPFTGQGLENLRGLDGLHGLTFFWHVANLSPDALRILADLPNLGVLGCDGRLCNDVAMRHIGGLPRLRMLIAQGTVASDDGFAALSRSPTIEHLWGRECPNLASRGFTALASMPRLQGLGVSCKHVEDAALATLPGFPALRQLMPMDVPDAGFRHVGRCEQLERLWCMYCRETGDAATAHVGGLTRLRSYYAGLTGITDRSLEILGSMDSLEQVELHQCARITNAGLAALAGLPKLRELTVGGSPRVTREGFAVFPASVHVDYS